MDSFQRDELEALMEYRSIWNDDDEDESAALAIIIGMNYFLPGTRNLSKRTCIKGYVEETVPLYSPSVFKSHFRLHKTTIELLISYLSPRLTRNLHRSGRPPVSPEKKILCVVWLLGNQESFRSVADRFDLSKSMLSRFLNSISGILAEEASKFIHWPSDLSAVESDFEESCHFPGVIGAIDGTHVIIKAPHVSPHQYFNRKKDYSLVLQAVCIKDLSFTDVTCSFPGSVHDARVFANSDVHRMLDDPDFFPDHTHLLGDAAYPLKVNLLVPYKDDGHLSSRQRNFNTRLSKTRVSIERAFSLLKGRFRRLKFFDADVTRIPLYVLAACVLHNICIKENDFFDFDTDDEGPEDLVNDTDDNLTASHKRDYICGILP